MSGPESVEVLLVEDDPTDLQLAMRALQKANPASHLRVAHDGAEALSFIFCEGSHAGRSFDLMPKVVLLDLKLPKIDGLQLLQRMKGDPRKTIPVVVLASSKEPSDVLDSYQLGVNSYIVKPVNFERFAGAVQELVTCWLLLNQSPKLES